MMQQRKIVTIVPVFNEEKTVAIVLKTLGSYNDISDIICVSDGSTDNSVSVIEKECPKVRLINLQENKGKGNAIAEGIMAADADILLFIDADLATLNHKHLDELLKPVLNDNYRAVIGYPMENIADVLYKKVGGQRAYFKNDLLPLLEDMRSTKYGLELFLNRRLKELRTKKIGLKNLGHVIKYQKRKPDEFIKECINWAIDVASESVVISSIEDDPIIKKLRQLDSIKEAEEIIARIKNKKLMKKIDELISKILKSY